MSDLENPNANGDQSMDVMFDIEGEQKSFRDLNPQTVQEWYSSHQNMSNWQKENTQKAQEYAEKQKELDAYKKSVEQQVNDYNALRQWFQQNPAAAQMIQQYHSKAQQMPNYNSGQFQKQQIPPEMEEKVKELEELKKQVNERFESEDRVKQRESAYELMAKQYGDKWNRETVEGFVKSMNLDKPEEFYDIVTAAALYKKNQKEQAKQGAGLQQDAGTTPYARDERTVIQRNPNTDPMDEVFAQFAKEQGIEDY